MFFLKYNVHIITSSPLHTLVVSNIHFQQIFFNIIERLDIFLKLHVSFISEENKVLHVMFDDVVTSLYVSQLQKFCKVMVHFVFWFIGKCHMRS